MKYYVVTDVHGFYTELVTALTEKGFFEDREPHKLIICGDLFDRGRETLKMQAFIVDLLEKDEVILIRGNHEDLAVEFIENIRYWMTPKVLSTHHWNNGTILSMLDLAGMELGDAYQAPNECAKRVQRSLFFQTILPAMGNYFETEHYIFVHGWIPCHALGPLGRADPFHYKSGWRGATAAEWGQARWYNGMVAAIQDVTEPGKTIVCGHRSASYGHAYIEGKGSYHGDDADYSPFYAKGIIALDTCTAASGKVNCIILED